MSAAELAAALEALAAKTLRRVMIDGTATTLEPDDVRLLKQAAAQLRGAK